MLELSKMARKVFIQEKVSRHRLTKISWKITPQNRKLAWRLEKEKNRRERERERTISIHLSTSSDPTRHDRLANYNITLVKISKN